MVSLVYRLIILFFLTFSISKAESEKVTLLLKWHHQFQFAGFYMAKEKGYYDEFGLDVDMKVSIGQNTAKNLENSQSTYAILDPIAFVEQSKGTKIKALAAVFQQSPLVFLTLKSSNIKEPQDFVNKKVMTVLGKRDASLSALLKEQKIELDKFTLISQVPTIKDLTENKVDVIAAYLTDAPNILKNKGYEYNIIDPLAYGINFYGDMIFTSENELKNNHSRSQRFLAATQKGWEYAFANIDETIDVILNKYSSSLSKETLAYEAKVLKELMMMDRIPFGMINERKINDMVEIFSNLGLTDSNIKLEYENHIKSNDSLEFWKTLTKEEKALLNNNSKFSIGVQKNHLPFFGQDENGINKGLIPDLNKKLEDLLGIYLELKPIDSVDMIQKKIDSGDINLFYGNSTSFGSKYIYSNGFGTFSGGVFSKDSNLKVKSIKDLEGKKVSTLKGYALEKDLIQTPTINYIPKKDTLDLIDSLMTGETEIIIDSLPSLEYYQKEFNLKNIHMNGIFYNFPISLAVGTDKQMQTMINIINKAIKFIDQDELNNVFNEWFNKNYQQNVLNLTEEELKFIKKSSTIKVGIDNDWAPFEFTKNGIAQGYSIDFIKTIEKISGLKFEIIGSYPWDETIKKFKNSEIDMLSLIGKNKERENYTLYTSAVLSSSLAFASNKNNPIFSLEQMEEKSLKLGVIKDYWFVPMIKFQYPKIKLIEFSKKQDALIQISTSKLDAFLDTSAVLQYHLNKNLISNVIISNSISIKNEAYQEYHIGVNKNQKILHSIIQKSLNKVPEIEILELQRKWFGQILEGMVSKQFLLNDKEKEFLYKNPNIKIGIDTSWAPFDFVDKNGNHQGIVADITKNILQENLGLQTTKIIKPYWKELIEDISNKEVDVITRITKTPDRSEKMLFSIPYVKIPMVVVGRNEEIFITSLDDLEGEEIGVVDGYLSDEILQKKYPKIRIKRYPDVKTGLLNLSRKEIDFFFDNLGAINNVIRDNGLTDIKLLGQTKESIELSFGIRKDWPELKDAIDKIITSTPQNQVDSIIQKWISISLKERINYELIWKISISFLIITLIIFYWNRKLKNEIEKRKVVEKELEEAKIKAESANKAKSVFLSNMSHEIRTPMNAILGFTELTSKMDLPSKALYNINIIQKSANALISIINDILDLSKIEAGKLEIKKEVINIENLIEDTFSIFTLKAQNKNLFFDISLNKEIPKALIVDEGRVRQILINLIGNAIKFTNKGYVKVSFNAKANPKEDSTIDLEIKIEDSGIGIKDKDLERIFAAFEQQDGQDNKLYGGTGLGLSISRKLAQLMDGEISAYSKGQNKGSIFTFVIPHVEIATSLPNMDFKIVSNELEFEPAKILIVDDIEANLDLLENILDNYKFKVFKATSGEESIKLSQELQPNLILMDIKMPNINGFEASKIIKANEFTKNIPVVAVSASVLDARESSLKSGIFDDFIDKPIELDKLEAVLKYFLKFKIKNEPKVEINKNYLFDIENNDIKKAVLELINLVFENGDIEKAKEIVNIFKNNKLSNSTIEELDKAIDNFDIEILENILKNIQVLLIKDKK